MTTIIKFCKSILLLAVVSCISPLAISAESYITTQSELTLASGNVKISLTNPDLLITHEGNEVARVQGVMNDAANIVLKIDEKQSDSCMTFTGCDLNLSPGIHQLTLTKNNQSILEQQSASTTQPVNAITIEVALEQEAQEPQESNTQPSSSEALLSSLREPSALSIVLCDPNSKSQDCDGDGLSNGVEGAIDFNPNEYSTLLVRAYDELSSNYVVYSNIDEYPVLKDINLGAAEYVRIVATPNTYHVNGGVDSIQLTIIALNNDKGLSRDVPPINMFLQTKKLGESFFIINSENHLVAKTEGLIYLASDAEEDCFHDERMFTCDYKLTMPDHTFHININHLTMPDSGGQIEKKQYHWNEILEIHFFSDKASNDADNDGIVDVIEEAIGFKTGNEAKVSGVNLVQVKLPDGTILNNPTRDMLFWNYPLIMPLGQLKVSILPLSGQPTSHGSLVENFKLVLQPLDNDGQTSSSPYELTFHTKVPGEAFYKIENNQLVPVRMMTGNIKNSQLSTPLLHAEIDAGGSGGRIEFDGGYMDRDFCNSLGTDTINGVEYPYCIHSQQAYFATKDNEFRYELKRSIIVGEGDAQEIVQTNEDEFVEFQIVTLPEGNEPVLEMSSSTVVVEISADNTQLILADKNNANNKIMVDISPTQANALINNLNDLEIAYTGPYQATCYIISSHKCEFNVIWPATGSKLTVFFEQDTIEFTRQLKRLASVTVPTLTNIPSSLIHNIPSTVSLLDISNGGTLDGKSGLLTLSGKANVALTASSNAEVTKITAAVTYSLNRLGNRWSDPGPGSVFQGTCEGFQGAFCGTFDNLQSLALTVSNPTVTVYTIHILLEDTNGNQSIATIPLYLGRVFSDEEAVERTKEVLSKDTLTSTGLVETTIDSTTILAPKSVIESPLLRLTYGSYLVEKSNDLGLDLTQVVNYHRAWSVNKIYSGNYLVNYSCEDPALRSFHDNEVKAKRSSTVTYGSAVLTNANHTHKFPVTQITGNAGNTLRLTYQLNGTYNNTCANSFNMTLMPQ